RATAVRPAAADRAGHGARAVRQRRAIGARAGGRGGPGLDSRRWGGSRLYPSDRSLRGSHLHKRITIRLVLLTDNQACDRVDMADEGHSLLTTGVPRCETSIDALF